MHEEKQRRAIIGVGNILLTDEGVGIHAVRRLEQMETPADVAIFDGGTEGFGLMDVIIGLDRLIIIDCVRAGEAPGTIFYFDADDSKVTPDKYQTSVHQVGIAEILSLVELVGKRPHTTIVGVQPASLEMGMTLSPIVEERLAHIVKLSLDLLERPSASIE